MLTKYLLVWFLLAAVATANGVIRQITYGRSLSDLAAHQISTVTAVLASGTLVWCVNRAWPIESSSQAFLIGTGGVAGWEHDRVSLLLLHQLLAEKLETEGFLKEPASLLRVLGRQTNVIYSQ